MTYHFISSLGRLCAGLLLCFFLACQTAPSGPWADFLNCSGKSCITETIAVKDALLKDPKATLMQFDATYRKGDDRVVGWLSMLRDSVLAREQYGTAEQRTAMQQAIVAAVKPYEADQQLGEVARSVSSEIGAAKIAAPAPKEEIVDTFFPHTGTYAFELPKEAGSGEVKVSGLTGGRLRFTLHVVAGPPAYNQGSMEGDAVQRATNVFEYTTTAYGGTCRLEFTFAAEALTIKTLEGDDGTCGFGHNVRADQSYKQTSYDDPFLSAVEVKKARNLTGQWVSTTDAQSELHLEKGRYTEVYQGEQMSTAPYQYFASCPQDCNPVANTPCLKVMGQDNICYVVVKADGKVLELSMIGGRGNTLAFKRK